MGEKRILASEPGVLLGLFPPVLLGVATITVVGVAVLSGRSFIEGFPYFRSFISGDGLRWITLSSFMVMPHIAASVPTSTCVVLGGLLPQHSGLVVGNGCTLHSSLDEKDVQEEGARCGGVSSPHLL